MNGGTPDAWRDYWIRTLQLYEGWAVRIELWDGAEHRGVIELDGDGWPLLDGKRLRQPGLVRLVEEDEVRTDQAQLGLVDGEATHAVRTTWLRIEGQPVTAAYLRSERRARAYADFRTAFHPAGSVHVTVECLAS